MKQVHIETATITGENEFTDPVRVVDYGTLILSGTFSASVALQASPDNGVTWLDTGDSFTDAGIYPFTDHTVQKYRAGVKVGGYTSGIVSVTIRGV